MKNNSKEKLKPLSLTVRFDKSIGQKIRTLSESEMRSLNMTVNILVREGLEERKLINV